MKRLFILLAIFPLTAFCQNKDSIGTKKISIGLTFSPDYCYRTLKPDASVKWVASGRDTLEIPKFGYTTGLNFALHINKRIALEAGFLFSDKGEKTKKYSLIWITPSGQPDPTLPTKNTFIYHYIYLDIPIKADYYILTNRTKFYITAGVSPNIFITQKTTSILEYSDGNSNTTTSSRRNGFDKINLTVIAGFGFAYDLTKRIYFKLEPIYRRSISTIIDAPIKGYLYSAGLNAGVYVKI